MKKLLLAAMASAAVLSSSIASAEDYNASLSLGVEIGVSHVLPKSIDVTDSKKLKLKTDHTPFATISVGYGFMDNLRGDLALSYFFSPKLSKKGKLDGVDVEASTELSIMSFMWRGFFDVVDMGPAKFFLGAGIGGAQVNEKWSSKASNVDLLKDVKAKKKNNLALGAYTGLSTELSPNVYAQLMYGYEMLGKSGTKEHVKDGVKFKVGGTKVNAHSLRVGIRFGM